MTTVGAVEGRPAADAANDSAHPGATPLVLVLQDSVTAKAQALPRHPHALATRGPGLLPLRPHQRPLEGFNGKAKL